MAGSIRVAVDVALAGVSTDGLRLLLVQRAAPPYKGKWALPGVALREDETLEVAACRAVEQRAGLTEIPLRQIGAYGELRRDPRNRVVAISYATLVRTESVTPHAGRGTEHVAWWPTDSLPPLAFDHTQQASAALATLRAEVAEFRLGFELLPSRFTLTELQQLHEAVFGSALDKPNFRRRVLERGVVREVVGEFRREGRGRPAQVYRFHG